MTITEDELRGLTFLGDALATHFFAGYGTGDDHDDAKAKAAARWVGRAVSYAFAHPQPAARKERKRR